jgi:tetratricopeptide (TPR) repeat protein
MRLWVPGLVFISLLSAADEQQLAISLKAQTDFERVELSAMPLLPDTQSCAQSQAAAISVALPEDLSTLHYRKGYCLLAGATVTGNRQEYAGAASELDKAIEAWPARVRKPVKNAPPQPVSSGLLALDALAHLSVDGEAAARPLLLAAVKAPACSTGLTQEQVCRQWVETARQWLGRMALNAESLDEAVTEFSGEQDTGWLDWAQGKRAFAAGNYAQAASRYSSAIQTWKAVWRPEGPTFARRLGPRPDLAAALADLGGAQLLAGNAQATATLDAALKIDPASARAFYLRARARELSGRASDALADYNLAARAAFAASQDLASGEAHLYRGILLFRRKDYPRAEDEFASALNFSIAAGLRPDAEAWRYLAAVASGSCAAARQDLERTIAGVSPYFPKQEARAIAASCPTSSAN